MNTASAHWQYALAKSELSVANILNEGKGKAMANLNRARAAYRRSITGKPPCPRYDDTIPVQINGIPASVHILHFDRGLPAKLTGHPDSWAPEEPPEIEYVICNESGYEAGWLADMADSDDVERQIMDWMGNDDDY